MSDTTTAGTDNAMAVYQGLLQPVPLTAAGGDPVTTLSFIAYLKVGEKDVPVKSGNLLRLAEEGIEFSLPEGTVIDLGTLQQLVNWLCEQMNLTKPDWTNLPTALQQITSAPVKIETLFVKANKATVQFDIAVSLTFNNWTIIGNLKMEKFTFRLARLQAATPPPA